MNSEAHLLDAGTDFAGRYRIEALIGRGGAGAVYRALDFTQSRPVALKVLAPDVVDDGTGILRFRREADLVQRLSHPNVVRIYDFGRTSEGLAYLVLELLRGQTLSTLLRNGGALPLERISRIGSQVLKGLMAAHALGIVHRDIKPSNIHVADFPGEPDFVTIVDFGIAKTPQDTGATTGLTRTGVLIGTPAYMAPEQALGTAVGPFTDVYAVGLVLAEMIAGRRVLGEGTAMHVLVAQASEAPVPLPDEVRASPLGPLIERATRKNPAQRFGSAAEMLAALEATGSRPWAGAQAPPPAYAHAATAMLPHPATPPREVGPVPFHAVGPGARPASAWPWVLGALTVVGGGVALVALFVVFFSRRDADVPPAPSTGPTPSAPVATSAPPADAGPPPSGLPSFNRRVADQATQSASDAAARACNRFGPPFGPGQAFIGFTPGGSAKGTTANHPNGQTRTCMESAMRSARIAPFDANSSANPLGTASFNVVAPAPTIIPPRPTIAPTPTPTPIKIPTPGPPNPKDPFGRE